MEKISLSLRKALNLELDGYEFYTKCAQLTDSKEAKEMFNFLAREEQTHYERIEDLYQENFREEYFAYERCIRTEEPNKSVSKIFDLEKLHEKADVLDALNLGIKAENESISLYGNLAQSSENKEMKEIFEKLVEEEKKHLLILEGERETVTDTGAFKDFKIVTM